MRKALSWVLVWFVIGFFAGSALAAVPPAAATATEQWALTGGTSAEAILDALEVRAVGGVETWRFRFRTFGRAAGSLPEYQLRFEERQESLDRDGMPQTRRPARLVLLIRRLRRVRPTPEQWTVPASKSDWIEKVRLWPAIDGDERAFEFELREGGTHRLVARGDTLELQFSPARTMP
jgi:hypothetical protein